jgi:beta-galactosidase
VDAPHDALINTQPSYVACPGGCSGNSYIPRYPSWYRKSFRLPQDWAGKAVWIYFDGVFRDATVFLNGKNLTAHTSGGYTSFQLRIDDQAGVLKFGQGAQDTNVMAILTDPDTGKTGW